MFRCSPAAGYAPGSPLQIFILIGRHAVLGLCVVIALVSLSWIGPIQVASASTDSPQTLITHHINKAPSPSRGKSRGRSPSSNRLEAESPAEERALDTMPPDIERILQRGKLVVAVLGQDNAPFFMDMGQGDLGGLDIQLAKAIAEQLQVKLELNRSAKTFNGVVDAVYAREADMAISKISRTMKRARRVRFSHPYLQMRQGLLINRLQLAQQTQSDNVTTTIRNLTGKVGVIKGSSYVGFLQQKFPKATIVEMPAWTDIVDAVSAGEILAGYRDELEIKKVVLTKPDAALQLKTAVLTDAHDALAIVMPWDSTQLLAFTNQYLDALAQEYTVDGLLEEYSGYWLSQKTAS